MDLESLTGTAMNSSKWASIKTKLGMICASFSQGCLFTFQSINKFGHHQMSSQYFPEENNENSVLLRIIWWRLARADWKNILPCERPVHNQLWLPCSEWKKFWTTKLPTDTKLYPPPPSVQDDWCTTSVANSLMLEGGKCISIHFLYKFVQRWHSVLGYSMPCVCSLWHRLQTPTELQNNDHLISGRLFGVIVFQLEQMGRCPAASSSGQSWTKTNRSHNSLFIYKLLLSHSWAKSVQK